MLGLLKLIDKTLENIEKERQVLINKILALPQNPDIKQLGNNCFTLNSSQLNQESWLPGYYDFKWQYKKIAEIINSCRLETLKSVFCGILEKDKKGKFKNVRFLLNGHNIKFNPKVLSYIDNLME